MTLLPLSKKTLWLLPVIVLQACLAGGAAYAATSISQFGITWTFDRDYRSGQFANGDYWVVGPVKITSITPRSTSTGGTVLHGSMINPAINHPTAAQGYDSRMIEHWYDPAMNVGTRLPLTLAPGTSLISSESYPINAPECAADKAAARVYMKTVAILTVLNAPAPAGSFRPPPVGTDKTLRWNKSQLDYSKLRSLPIVANTPSLASVEATFARPWLEQDTRWTGRYLHAGGNQPTYGRELAHAAANGLLSLQLNYSNAQKEKLLIRMVQYGIDIYGSARLGAIWPAGGGHNHGRKMPMLLAGTVLGDASILAYADGKRQVFQEDRQTWYVVQSDVGRVLYTADGRPREQYIQSDVGKGEWGEQHMEDPRRDGRNWSAYYRTVAGASTIGHVLAARIMGVQSVWNWPAAFDYYDRYYGNEASTSSVAHNEIQPFVKSMWVAYRNAMPADLNDDTVSTSIWQNRDITAQTGSFSVVFDLMPSRTNMDGVTGVSNGAADAYADLAAAVRLNPSGCIDVRNGGGWQALSQLNYQAGVKYHVVMSINVATKRYTVTVTAPGGTPVTLAKDFPFRTEQSAVSRLSNVGYFSGTGSHAVLNLASQATP